MANTPAPAARPADATVIASPMIATLERAWDAIRVNHPELPRVVVIMGSGLSSTAIKLGHFHAEQWGHREADTDNALDVGPAAAERYSELFVGGEGLARQPHEIMATLLHEAAHCLAHVRGIQDTSRQGRWHNRKFAELAAEVGISVERDPKIGYSITSMPDETSAKYMDTILMITTELQHVRRMPALVRVPTAAPTGGAGGTAVAPAPVVPVRKRPGARCQCDTPREVQIARAALAQAPILCGVCLAPFAYAD
jgi:hypothetical protein